VESSYMGQGQLRNYFQSATPFDVHLSDMITILLLQRKSSNKSLIAMMENYYSCEGIKPNTLYIVNEHDRLNILSLIYRTLCEATSEQKYNGLVHEGSKKLNKQLDRFNTLA